MSTFFSDFPEFPYDPAAEKQDEFNRLRDAKGWIPSSPEHKAHYKAFRLALIKEVGAAVDKFFLTEYPTRSFNYRTTASPWMEFRRLMYFRHIAENSNEYRHAEACFKDVFNQAFSRDLDQFFRSYSKFEYNPRNEPKAEFNKLRHHKNWFFPQGQSWSPEYTVARDRFFNAFIADFTYFFGVGDDLRDWEFLCDVLRIWPMPQTIEACQAALESYYVNIFDLYNHVQWGTHLDYHVGERELSDYSYDNNLIFPKYLAKTTCMKVLLRRLNDEKGMPAPNSSGCWSGVISINKRLRRPSAA